MQTLLDKGYDPLEYRYLCLTANYRSDLKFTWESLDAAQTALGRLRNSVYSWGQPGTADQSYVSRFSTEIYNDLNIPKALVVVWDLIKSNLADDIKKATILVFDKVLGLNLEHWQPEVVEIPDHIMDWVERRTEARNNKDWQVADEIRNQIEEQGFDIEDSAEGPKITKK